MIAAAISGIAVIFIVDVAWLVGIKMQTIPHVLLFIAQGSPLIAGFISSYLAPRRKILLGVSMAIPTAFFFCWYQPCFPGSR